MDHRAKKLIEKFPKCDECDTVLHLSRSGWLCPNNHGGIIQVSPEQRKDWPIEILTGHPCYKCKGKKVSECEICEGEGSIECITCGSETDCDECDGAGTDLCTRCFGVTLEMITEVMAK